MIWSDVEKDYAAWAQQMSNVYQPNELLKGAFLNDHLHVQAFCHEKHGNINQQEPRFGKLTHLLEPKPNVRDLWDIPEAAKKSHNPFGIPAITELALFSPEITNKFCPRISGMTALHYCVIYGLKVSIKTLLGEPTIDPNLQDLPGGNTALHYAVATANEDIVGLIARHYKCDPYIANKKSQTPLMMAYELADSLKSFSGPYTMKLKKIICILEKSMDKSQTWIANNQPIIIIPMSNA
ncbi:hypothetical protein Noda2021_11170 [Candidatus Dependentiae bacterium Noda2021]|nr:hypothetical protein Noda2021_11170 [Candidatus Dependentiae bacterium Noda2021]